MFIFEFLLDMDNHSYYFMECNPRLQVEATITEEIWTSSPPSSASSTAPLSLNFSPPPAPPLSPPLPTLQRRLARYTEAQYKHECRQHRWRVSECTASRVAPEFVSTALPLLACSLTPPSTHFSQRSVCVCVCVYHHQPRGNRVRY